MIRAWAVGILWQKEWRNGMRDRRGFWLTMLMPVLTPVLLFLLIPLVMASIAPRLKGDLLTIAVQGELGKFEQSLSLPQQSALQWVGVRPVKLEPVPDARAAVESGKYRVALEMPQTLPEQLDAERIDVSVYIDPSSRSARASELLIRAAVADFNKRLQQQRLAQLGAEQTGRDALTARFISIGEKGSVSMMILGVILPFLVIVWGCTGAQWIAVDACAAERERGTFETLLVAPITRLEVILGKYFAAFSAASMCSVLGLLGFALLFFALRELVQSQLGPLVSQVAARFLGPVQLDISNALHLILSAIAVAMASSALVLLPGWFARTYREVQMYAVPGIFAAMGLAGLGLAADFLGFQSFIAWVPISGSVASMSQALNAQASLASTLIGALSSSALALLALWLMARLLRRESVIFRN